MSIDIEETQRLIDTMNEGWRFGYETIQRLRQENQDRAEAYYDFADEVQGTENGRDLIKAAWSDMVKHERINLIMINALRDSLKTDGELWQLQVNADQLAEVLREATQGV